MKARVFVEEGGHHFVVLLVEDPARDTAMGPDDRRFREAPEDFLELVEVLVLVMDAHRGAVLMNEDGEASGAAELVDIEKGRMIDPGRLFVGHVRQVVMPAEDLADAAPERILVEHPLDVPDGVLVRRIEAADERGEPLPRRRREAEVGLGQDLVGQVKIIAPGVVVQIIMGRMFLEGVPLLLERKPEDDGLGDPAGVHRGQESGHPVALLDEVHEVQMRVDYGNDRPCLGVGRDLMMKFRMIAHRSLQSSNDDIVGPGPGQGQSRVSAAA